MTETSDDLIAIARGQRESVEDAVRRTAERAFALQAIAAVDRREAGYLAVIEQFLAKHPGVPLAEMITIAKDLVREAEAAVKAAETAVEAAQEEVDRTRESKRDLEGHLRILRERAAGAA